MKIDAELIHPEIQGPPLERGARYGHHFVVELISDGKRLWAVASDDGRKILYQIAHSLTGEEPKPDPGAGAGGPTIAEWVAAGYSPKNYLGSGYTLADMSAFLDDTKVIIEDHKNADGTCTVTERYLSFPDGSRRDLSIVASAGVGNQSGTGSEPVPNPSDSLDPDGKPPTGGTPEPTDVTVPGPNGGEAPTTTTASANTFDS